MSRFAQTMVAAGSLAVSAGSSVGAGVLTQEWSMAWWLGLVVLLCCVIAGSILHVMQAFQAPREDRATPPGHHERAPPLQAPAPRSRTTQASTCAEAQQDAMSSAARTTPTTAPATTS
ncbi:hypothetical protein F4561_006044 [Lipingzhangella halophila]|uniref:Uncharacterized protein n=1 Tax=Lipingzhangella halophila TaxID=1783352 RepID=A0A7W7RNA1_9ACTN|nr:hypothetical protein [Lipingzhangella halophila]